MGMMTLNKIGDEIMSGKTNIQVSRSTRNRLAELGKKDDSYDDIIIRLLNFYESKGDDIDG